jgi:hypothetical protein
MEQRAEQRAVVAPPRASGKGKGGKGGKGRVLQIEQGPGRGGGARAGQPTTEHGVALASARAALAELERVSQGL